MPHRELLLLLSLFYSCAGYTQDSSVYLKLRALPDKLFQKLDNEPRHAEQQLARQTEKYLNRLARQEQRLKKQLWKKDSAAAKAAFGDAGASYAKLNGIAGGNNVYSSKLDSMQTALRFLGKSGVAGSYAQLQQRLNAAGEIKQRLKEREQVLKREMEQFGLTKAFRKYRKEVYYYRAQVDEYRNIFNDPSKLESKLLQLANKVPAFKDFFTKHSMLASMFRLPGNDPAVTAAPIPGLQTRAGVQQGMIERFGTGPDVSLAMQENVQSAQAQINQLKEKVQQLGGGSSDMDMPDFKPNTQRTKSFWNRIELGANMQSVRGNSFYPVTSDIGLSAGYKLNDKSVIGLGASYKLGWGQNIRQIKITHEGVGLRSFVDVKIKGSFYASGGFEYNYQQPFVLQQLPAIDHWQQSGLVGVSKVIAVRSKLFRKTKLQLLWDFLSYQQIQASQPIKFRIGYHFK